MNSEAKHEEILNAAFAALHRVTGLTASLINEPPQPDGGGMGALSKLGLGKAEALIEIQTDRGPIQLAAQIKAVDRFQTPAQIKAQLSSYAELPLLVAPFISRGTAEHCRDLHLSFIDMAGNAYLEAPGLYIYVTGQPRPKDAQSPGHRAFGAAGLQVTFALLARPDLIHANYRDIAHAAGVALGTITHVMRDLEARGFLTGEGRRTLLDPRRLLDEWVTHYPITLRPKLHPKRFEAAQERFAQADLASPGAYWGGERAAQRLTQFLKPGAFTIYTRKPMNRLVAELRLRAHPAGNVEVLDTFWNFAPDTEYPDLAPPALIYADLLATRDGRNIEAANMIYEQRIEPTFSTFKTAH